MDSEVTSSRNQVGGRAHPGSLKKNQTSGLRGRSIEVTALNITLPCNKTCS